MTTQKSNAYPLVPHFERHLAMTESERQALAALLVRIVSLEADQDIVHEGDRPSHCVLVLEGFAATSKVTADGRRQTSALHIAGNWPDLQSLHLDVLDSDVRTISACVLAFVDHDHVRTLCEQYPRLAALLWRTTLIDGAIYREWVTNLGQRQAYSRIAHLFCEMMVRMEDAGLARDKECALPLTQSQLGDASGMSSVHVNRVLQALREAELIEFKSGRLQVLDWDGLVAAGEFDTTYLHRTTNGGTRGQQRDPSATNDDPRLQ